jgi:tetratricopeptide (TPR) repeat protein
MLAAAKEQTGRRQLLDQAIADFGRALNLNPADAKAIANRGHAYLLRGDNNNAIADETKAIEIVPTYAEAYLYRGLAYLNKGDGKNATKDLRQAWGNTKDPALRDQVATKLADLGYRNPSAEKKDPKAIKVFFLYLGTDRTAVDQVRDSLTRLGYNVQPVEQARRPIMESDVRYFDDTDRLNAQDIVQEVIKSLKAAGLPSQVKLKPLVANVPIGQIEVWLPVLEKPQPNPPKPGSKQPDKKQDDNKQQAPLKKGAKSRN